MGNVNMEASQINYRGGETKMSVEEALKSTSGEAAAIAQLQTDVGNLQTTKANQITIAPFFSAETAYDPGDLVYYNGLTYRCVNAHEGEWDADDFAATTISNELDALKSGLTEVNSKLTDKILVVPFTATWESNIYGYTESAVIDPLNNGYKLIGVVNNYASSETTVVGMSYMFVYGFRVATDKSSIIVIADTEYNQQVRLDFIYIKVS